jgi:ubiquinone/menaquinone biosynthesis C-methylase UbiE
MSGDAHGENPRRTIFNELAPAWDSMCALSAEQSATLRSSLSGLALAADASILDVGCGTGVLVPYLLPFLGEGGRYTGLDVSDGMIAVARGKCRDPRVAFVVRDLYDLSPRKSAYDDVIVFSAFPHLHDKAGALSAFAELLRAKGRLCILHVESSREINAYHGERVSNEVLKRDHLPSIEEMRALIDSSVWSLIDAQDRPGLYRIVAERR